MSCSGSHLGITINIKDTKFVKDLPMIDAQFRFNQCATIFSDGRNRNVQRRQSIVVYFLVKLLGSNILHFELEMETG
jgi:hypothetical protein